MRKLVALVSLVAVSLMFSLAAFAEMPVKAANSTAAKTDSAAGKCCKGEMGMKDGFMHGMMMNNMMRKQMAATSDGGVIVLVGNKIMKYDKNLNLVKEAEIKIDKGCMNEKMEKKGHHHMGKWNKGDKEEANETAAAPSGNQPAAQQ